MNEFVKFLGIMLLTTIAVAIPILTACSLILKWNAIMSMFLILFTFFDFIALSVCITDALDE